jgi:dihydroorotase
MGGVTAVFEMPNTNPNTDTADRVADKLARAHHRMWCDHAFYVGATAENAEHLGELERIPGTAGVKIFMGASTGSLLVSEDADLARVLAHGSRRVAIHAEDEARMNARKDLASKAMPPAIRCGATMKARCWPRSASCGWRARRSGRSISCT